MSRLSVCFGMFDFGLLGMILTCLSTFFCHVQTLSSIGLLRVSARLILAEVCFVIFRAKMRSFRHVLSCSLLRHVKPVNPVKPVKSAELL